MMHLSAFYLCAIASHHWCGSPTPLELMASTIGADG